MGAARRDSEREGEGEGEGVGERAHDMYCGCLMTGKAARREECGGRGAQTE